MQNPAAQQVTKALKDANNVLVTVRNSPSVDELTAAVGLTLVLNRMGKHAVTVFSGRVPSTIEFLQPETAIDTNTDSLRDFIIALDKAKADKLRYKVEDNVVRIFITPYKTSITEKDLEFSQGDFNVDVVVALGVVAKEDFDQAVTTHGRILHDATVITVTKQGSLSQMGAINWQEPQASSVSEMMASVVDGLGPNLLDGQTATAFLTGIVAETDRFKNSTTTPQVLSLSSKLMEAGANPQLIAEKLEEPDVSNMVRPLESGGHSDDGSLEIDHGDEDTVHNIEIDDSGNLQLAAPQPGADDQSQPSASAAPTEGSDDLPILDEPPSDSPASGHSYLSSAPPPMFGQDDSGTEVPKTNLDEQSATGLRTDRQTQPALDLAPPSETGAGSHHKVIAPLPSEEDVASAPQPAVDAAPVAPEVPAEQAGPMPEGPKTLADLEQAVGSSHSEAASSTPNVDDFLGTSRPEPQPEPETPPAQETPLPAEEPQPEEKPEEKPPAPTPTPTVINPSAPPPVPPPLMPAPPSSPQFYDADGNNTNPFLNPNS